MNVFLKACIDEVFDLVIEGEELVGKQYSAAIGNVVKIISDAGPIQANLGDAQAEFQALLKDPTADADVVAYVVSKVGAAGASPAISAVVSAAADLGLAVVPVVEKGVALINAIKAAKSA